MTANYLHHSLFIKEEASRCLLCCDAPCTAACENGLDPAKFIRSIHFDNTKAAAASSDPEACDSCGAPCEEACIHYDFPVRIRKMAASLEAEPAKRGDIDLSVDFCGVRCENPFFLSSSIVASSYEMCAKALAAGWGGVVFKTIGFLRPEEVSPRFDATEKEGTPFIGLRNLEQIAEHPLAENLTCLRRLKKDFPSKVIVASILGQSDAEWTELARLATEAGVDMIECNFSCPHMSKEGLGSDVGQSPELVRHFTACARKGTHLPILAKMTPNLGHIELPAIAAVEGGADGIAAINTIKSISSINLEKMAAAPYIGGKSAVSGYSGKAIKPIALRFIHDAAKSKALAGIPLSGMGGIETWRDAAEFIALGCKNVQVTTAVMQYGYGIIDDLLSGLRDFMLSHGYTSVDMLCGTALNNLVNPDELDRKTVVYPVFQADKCIGCGRCYVSCADAGHQAIRFDAETRMPALRGSRCVGCHLCILVCPVRAVGKSLRVPKRVH